VIEAPGHSELGVQSGRKNQLACFQLCILSVNKVDVPVFLK